MNKLLRIPLITVATLTASHAAPFMAIGDGADLFVTGTVGIRADDNIYLARNAESDLIFDLNPGLELTFGRNAQLKGSLTLVEQFANYSDNSGLNSNLFAGDFVSRFDDGKMKLGFNAKFHELDQNQFNIRSSVAGGGVRGNIRRDIFAAGGNSEVEFSQLTAFGAALQFDHEDFKPAGFTDSDSLTIPVNVFYHWTPKTDLSVGYRYRSTTVDLGQGSTDHFFNVGARGEFSPKLTGRFAVGVNTRRLEGGGKGTQLGLDASFRYEISPKTSLDVNASKDFGTGPRGQQERNLMLDATVTAKIAEEWMVSCGLRWRAINYGVRTDDYYEGQLSSTYVVNANVRIVGAYVYRNYGSKVRDFEFRNNVFSVAANFRY